MPLDIKGPCCPHSVERHAYNGCANCGCSVQWNKHPMRDYDTSMAGLEQNKTERDDIRADRDSLQQQVAELTRERSNLFATLGIAEDIELGRDPIEAARSVVDFGRSSCELMLKFEEERDALRVRVSEVYAEVDDMEKERDALLVRQQELLATIVRVTNETPFSDEAKDALEQRGKLVAEIGTLRAQVEEDVHTKDMFRRNLARCVDSRRNEATIQQELVRQRHDAEKQRDAALSRSQSDAAIVEAARRLVSRSIHRRQDHRELILRNVELLANDIVALTKLAEAVDAAERETK